MGVLLAVAVALIVLGGGDDESIADEAEAVCRDANEDVVASQAVLPANPTDEQATEFLRVVYVDLQRDRIAALRALGDDGALSALIDEHEAAVDRLQADPERFPLGGEGPFADIAPRWEAFGAPSCGRMTE